MDPCHKYLVASSVKIDTLLLILGKWRIFPAGRDTPGMEISVTMSTNNDNNEVKNYEENVINI